MRIYGKNILYKVPPVGHTTQLVGLLLSPPKWIVKGSPKFTMAISGGLSVPCRHKGSKPQCLSNPTLSSYPYSIHVGSAWGHIPIIRSAYFVCAVSLVVFYLNLPLFTFFPLCSVTHAHTRVFLLIVSFYLFQVIYFSVIFSTILQLLLNHISHIRTRTEQQFINRQSQMYHHYKLNLNFGSAFFLFWALLKLPFNFTLSDISSQDGSCLHITVI